MSRRDEAYDAARRFEVESVAPLFPAGGRLLEIGGGSGFQAALFTERGLRVRSFDLADRPRPVDQRFPVEDYDGLRLPVEDGSFDVVYSSSVLEHVADLPLLLTEMRRALAPDGRCVHVVPTPLWRAWTLFAHYPFVLKRLLRPGVQVPGGHVPSASEKASERGWGYVLRRALIPRAHGLASNAFTELADFAMARWRRRFEAAGFAVTEVRPIRWFGTGYGVLPLGPLWRKRLSRVLGCPLAAVVLTSPRIAPRTAPPIAPDPQPPPSRRSDTRTRA